MAWLLLALEMGCGGATRASPDGGSERAAAGGPASETAGTASTRAAINGSAGAPAAEGGAASAASGCDCVDAELAWWREGDSDWLSESRVVDCTSYSFREGLIGEPMTTSCGSLLEGCGPGFGVDDINLALAHPDVQAALARAPTLFGSDPRPNGGVDHIEIGGQVIEIGRACPDDPSCQVPAGVYELGQLLGHVRLFEQQRFNCTLK